MKKKELLVPLYIKGNLAADASGKVYSYDAQEAVRLAEYYGNTGADAIVIFDQSECDQEHDASIGLIREIGRAVDIPLYGGGNIRRMEDVKKLLYAGCKKVFLNYAKEGNILLTREVSERFGKEKILACAVTAAELEKVREQSEFLGGILFPAYLNKSDAETDMTYMEQVILETFYYISEDDQAQELLDKYPCTGVGALAYAVSSFDLMELKHRLHRAGHELNLYKSSVSWDEIKTNSDGLLPVVVQDYKTLEVLMVAYMNQEAYELTVRTGRMTYWSRSRQEIWIKGLTSGHFQYVKELAIDCDNDTLLAKVSQVGAACHTGNRTCFYRSVMKKEYDQTNPMKVFEEVYSVIEDRKMHPKEGSYTNYLFEKGIDKILKKLGEEATEIVIAAKNPDPEEIKYEISDFLYHAMVLMVERGVRWEDITAELARR